MSTSLLRFTKITAGFSRTLSLSVTPLGPKGKKPKKGGKGGGKNVTVEPLKAETVRIRVPHFRTVIYINERSPVHPLGGRPLFVAWTVHLDLTILNSGYEETSRILLRFKYLE